MTQTTNNKLFVDTNMLVYSSLPHFSEFARASQQMASLLIGFDEVWISRQIIREYIVTMTRPALTRGFITLEEIINNVRTFSASFQVADESQEVTNNLLSLLGQVSVQGIQIHDANIVATMQANNISHLVTNNVMDFTKYQNFITIIPFQ